jgi:phospholipid/cholesterol/gamma-HCH transport system permease protein
MRFLNQIGKYFIFLNRVFAKPESLNMYYRQIIIEIGNLGISSIGIVAIISVFIGAVITIQTAINITNPIFPKYIISLTVRDSILLEFSSSVVALILAGKIGSSIASEIGTMRVTEQIDALEIFGVNSASYLALPKVVAAMLFNPVLTVMSMVIGIWGGWVAGVTTGDITSDEYIYGVQYEFMPYYIVYGIVKTIVFAFIITTVSAFMGYNVSGGSLEVGQASTRAVVYSSVAILFFNVVLTILLLQ